MPNAPVSPEADAFLRKPNGAVIATIRGDGAPFTAATWYDWDGETIYVNMDEGRTRLRHMRRDPHIAITVFDIENWYWQVSLLGRVVRIEDDEGFSGIHHLARRYTGADYVDLSRGRVSAWIAVDSWSGWDPVNYTVWQPGVSRPPA
jgi:PPOX class probable F420-dependent enzyme